ncbi:MAG: hypothetical protein DRJ98_00870 [Thermoprotei archaeon]|nr:MAG: hypothetical protein DRJ98_00870 [Thermoprotei archaeon]RLF18881.1 MAG: hypothetical protein DRN06_00040 [Thermoprotei archaeon]
MKPGSKVYYSRSLMGIMAGLVCGALDNLLASLSPYVYDVVAIVVAAMIYYASILFARFVLNVKPDDLNNPAYLKKGGLFTFILLWLMVWSLTVSFQRPLPWP